MAPHSEGAYSVLYGLHIGSAYIGTLYGKYILLEVMHLVVNLDPK
jgi:hypothetical protein